MKRVRLDLLAFYMQNLGFTSAKMRKNLSPAFLKLFKFAHRLPNKFRIHIKH